ncbi:methionyl-tRNA formyltransferase [Sinosporangium siamense]|nr:formyltransferase family protein [Sinosporangium siamense]
MDLLLPGSSRGFAQALKGYGVDVVVACGLSWRLPKSVLDAPALGVMNVHASLLPKYRGPSPVQWALRNGDPDIGLTVHWMDERIDTGNILARRGGIPLPEFVTFAELWRHLGPAIGDLVADALGQAAGGSRGEPQDDSQASYAGAMERGFDFINWSHTAEAVHNQVRTFYFGAGLPGPFAKVDGEWLLVRRTSLTPQEGIRVECRDRPIWIVEWASARLPGAAPPSAPHLIRPIPTGT